MDDVFDLPVMFNSAELLFPARLLHYGYSYKLQTDIDGALVLFEPDEERNWRALVQPQDMEANKQLKPELLQAIASAIEAVLQ